MPLHNIRILSTRPLPESILVRAAAHSVMIDTASFIRTEGINTSEVQEKIKKLAAKKITAVFTSANAVTAVRSMLSSKPAWKVYCMGGSTREQVLALTEAGSIAATARDSRGLAKKIVADQRVAEIVFFCGDQRMDHLPDIVRAHQLPLEEVIVYHTVETPVVIEQHYEGIVFFSPSAVHSFFDVNTVPTDVIMFAIGKTTADTIATYVQNEIYTSHWPGKEQMIDQVIHYFETRP